MQSEPKVTDSKKRLLELFSLKETPESLEGLRAPSGSFRPETAEDLAKAGLIEFDTRTGIAFQTWHDWDIILTELGKETLKNSAA
jgi:hypothetical protein